jgi:2-iminobutanoate/2-iminopropanoate deaminase
MDKQIIPTEEAPAPIGPYSQAVMSGGTLYISGQVAIDPSTNQVIAGDIEAEARQVMHNVGAILKAYGLDYGHIVKTTIFLKDMADFARVNTVYGSFFEKDFPARETVEVSRLPKDVKVEISCIATGPHQLGLEFDQLYHWWRTSV